MLCAWNRRWVRLLRPGWRRRRPRSSAAAAAEAAAQLVAWDLRLLRGGLSRRRIAGADAAAVARTVLCLLTQAGKIVGTWLCAGSNVRHYLHAGKVPEVEIVR